MLLTVVSVFKASQTTESYGIYTHPPSPSAEAHTNINPTLAHAAS